MEREKGGVRERGEKREKGTDRERKERDGGRRKGREGRE